MEEIKLWGLEDDNTNKLNAVPVGPLPQMAADGVQQPQVFGSWTSAPYRTDTDSTGLLASLAELATYIPKFKNAFRQVGGG